MYGLKKGTQEEKIHAKQNKYAGGSYSHSCAAVAVHVVRLVRVFVHMMHDKIVIMWNVCIRCCTQMRAQNIFDDFMAKPVSTNISF